jgi:hypothetical protein
MQLNQKKLLEDYQAQCDQMMQSMDGMKEENNKDESLKKLADTIAESQKAIADALAQNTQVLTQMQSLTVDAIEDMADAIAAPRDIQLKKDQQGKTVGATSVAVLPAEEPGEQEAE